MNNCKNCIYSDDSRIPGFVLCRIKHDKVKQNKDVCEECEIEV